MPVAPPADVGFELVDRVEVLLRDETFCEAQRHRRVVGPLARLQVERPAADHVGERGERAGFFELQCGAESITRGESEQAPAVAVECGHGRFSESDGGVESFWEREAAARYESAIRNQNTATMTK
jgi:hypothetical protein